MRDHSDAAMHERIDRHFRGRLSPDEERVLRAHLPTCAACRDYYERHLALATVDPRALAPAERLAIGLGLRRRRSPLRPVTFALAAASTALLVIGLLVLLPEEPRFTARGQAAPSAAVELLVYRVTAGRPSARVESEIDADDELAFAYGNAAGKKHLLVFAVDELANVYWYYPAWQQAAANPRAIAIEGGAEIRELPEAVRHPLKGQRLEIVGLFSDEPLSVRGLEARLGSRGSLAELALPGTLRVARSFRVRQQGGAR